MRLSSLAALLCFALIGCGGGLVKFPTVKATGQVLCNGKPIENLRVYFRPLGQEKKAESGKVGE